MTTEIEQKALNRLLEALRNLGCSYAVIDKDGADYIHGNIVAKKRGKKAPRKYPYNTLKNHYGPWLTNLEPGGSTEIPADQFDLLDIQSGVCSTAVNLWGKGSCMTSMNREKNVLEVIRIL